MVIPSQMDDISSISPHDQTHIVPQNVDKNSGTSTYSAENGVRHRSQEPGSRIPNRKYLHNN